LFPVAASEVGQDGQDAAVGVVGLGEVEFGEDVADVFADGRLGDDESSGDRGVGVSFGDEGEDFAFACGQRGQRVAAAPYQLADDLGVDDGCALGRGACGAGFGTGIPEERAPGIVSV